jgi:microcystin-dependent protein
MLAPYAGATAPTGWLICDGGTFSATAYPQLAQVLGSTYGTISGDNYRLPDLRGRTPIGAGTGRNVADSANLTARTLGAKISDAETVTLTSAQSGVPAHSHPNTLSGSTAAASGHTHNARGDLGAAIGATNSNIAALGYVAGGVVGGGPSTSTYTVTGGVGGSQTFNHYTPVYGNTAGPSADTVVTISNVNNTAANAVSSHENMQPSIVLNYIIKV